jgi:superfamily II DNA or RNA helicase
MSSGRNGLRPLDLKPEYRSDKDNLVRDFYVPCLKHSQLYFRAVGFFTSRGLSVAAQGLTEFIDKGGKMRLAASPLLEPEDVDAIERGYAARQDIIKKALLRQIETVPDAVTRDRLGYLAWLISEERLEVRIAVPVSAQDIPRLGIYHEKLGIFEDGAGNVVAFTGSPNETASGLVDNFETIDTFWSWDDPQERVPRKCQNFDRLWRDETQGLSVIEFPEAVRRQLLKFKPREKPLGEAIDDEVRSIVAPRPHPDLWQHQREAIDAWEANQRRGIMSMATGSGKTLAALAAAERCPALKLLVIAVPRMALVEQWASEIQSKTQFPSPVLAYDDSASWQESLFTKLRAVRRTNAGGPVVVVGTVHSLSGARFNSVMDDAAVSGNTLLIVDEVHNVGAPSFRHALREDFLWRLGLSATPVRHFDEEGTGVIQDYFGSTVYVYDMRDALRDGRLCPYRYHIYAAHLSDHEYDQYQSLTSRLIQLRGHGGDEVTQQTHNVLEGDSDEIKQLLFRRARILKKCEDKAIVLRRVLDEHPMKRGLIYCADNDQLVELGAVLQDLKVIYLTYTAATPKDERRNALEALAQGHVPVLLAIDCLDEGVDVPSVDQAIIVASSSNKRQFIQRRGRILRRSVGKAYATLIDIVVLPPISAGTEAKKMLNGELARTKEMAELADNKYEALNQVKACTAQYGVLITELLTGEGDG